MPLKKLDLHMEKEKQTAAYLIICQVSFTALFNFLSCLREGMY